jgi:hypothetical protein
MSCTPYNAPSGSHLYFLTTQKDTEYAHRAIIVLVEFSDVRMAGGTKERMENV